MKMAPGVFWGILLVIIGSSIIIKIIFGVSLFRILLALFLIFMGIVILSGKTFALNKKIKSDTIFSEKTIHDITGKENEYNIVFGKNRFDFRNFRFTDNRPVIIEVNTVFGESEMVIPRDLPVKIKTDAVFSTAVFPDGNQVAFGTSYYTSDSFNNAGNYLYIESHVVFGKIQVISV